jgi:hypothetical protein
MEFHSRTIFDTTIIRLGRINYVCARFTAEDLKWQVLGVALDTEAVSGRDVIRLGS